VAEEQRCLLSTRPSEPGPQSLVWQLLAVHFSTAEEQLACDDNHTKENYIVIFKTNAAHRFLPPELTFQIGSNSDTAATSFVRL